MSNPGSTIIIHRQPRDIWRVDYQLSPGEDAEQEVREDRVRARIGRHLAWLGTAAVETSPAVSDATHAASSPRPVPA